MMDWDLFGILFMVVVFPVFAGIGYAIFHRWSQMKEAQMKAIGSDTAERAAQYAAKTERLEQRVAVLERLLTDRSTHLSDEIEALRDTSVN